jgi:hypothetical protein
MNAFYIYKWALKPFYIYIHDSTLFVIKSNIEMSCAIIAHITIEHEIKQKKVCGSRASDVSGK